MRKIGMSLGAINTISTEEYAALLKEYGFETSFFLADDMQNSIETAAVLEKYGISLDSMHAPWRGINSMWREGDEGKETLAMLTRAVDITKEVGSPICVVHLSSGLTPPPPTDIGRERFIRLVEYAAQKGIVVAFENQRMLGNIGWAFEEFKDCKYVGFCYDCGHEGCFTPGRKYMPLFGNRLVCTHIHDNDGIFNQDLHRLPFDGTLDYDHVTRAIRDSGYQGSLILEVDGKKDFYASLSPSAFFERAAQAAKKLRDMTDL